MKHLRSEINTMSNLNAKVDFMMTQFDEFRKLIDNKLTPKIVGTLVPSQVNAER